MTLGSVRNDGALAVTVHGLDPVVSDVDHRGSAGLGPVSLLRARTSWPTGDMLEPNVAPAVADVVVEPGAELEFWVHWRVGGYCPAGSPPPIAGGAGVGSNTIRLRWPCSACRGHRISRSGTTCSRRTPPLPLMVCPPA